uniref:SH2 domain-containing protein 1A n=1 Tax=Oncorhynchus gorbuscha TaxID=8017 RepID=UPI001EAF816A|nr:SH2 domain-containing protein 1A [Oncorhynchus gorbuscha]
MEQEKLAMYHGAISREEGEMRLWTAGRDGSYLIRNSESLAGLYCLCVLYKGYVYTYRLSLDGGGSWTAETTPGVEKRYFRKMKNLITAFQKPGQGIATSLLYPVTMQSHTHPVTTENHTQPGNMKAHPSSPPPTHTTENHYQQ